ncbi:MAG: hypothetical protein HQL38_06710 [Alphaproteobacteria bacterium]|nr:hypothetical protein [Alphaproteobacteria bacterium]
MEPRPIDLPCPHCDVVTTHMVYSAVAGKTEIRWCQSCSRVRMAGPGEVDDPPEPAGLGDPSAAGHLGETQA